MRLVSRRLLLAGSISTLMTPPLLSQDPSTKYRRATDGDQHVEPNWDERLTITVGQKSGDIVGSDDKAIQAAVDYVARLGTGTVTILPGTYMLRNAIVIPSGLRLRGSGAESVLTKIASESVPLAADSDWYDQEITLSQSGNFQVGDAVLLKAPSPSHGGQQVIKRTVVARSGNRLKLNDGLRSNLWMSQKPTCSSLFPLLTSEHTSDVVIENLTLDGNAENNANLNGNYGGNVFLQDCNRYTFRNIESRNYNGDGLSFQICHDVLVENCHLHDNRNLGVHPGSGSQRPILRGNRIDRNDQGIFWCWGVKFGLAEQNTIRDNRSYGISIGHNDTDNVMRDNEISGSGKIGILFRNDTRGQDFWANRNVIENNRIFDSGEDSGIGIDLRGETKDVVLRGNEIRERRAPEQRIGIRIEESVKGLSMTDNQFAGLANDVLDMRA